MDQKWFLRSKTILGALVSSLAVMQALPAVPAEYQPWIALVANLFVGANRLIAENPPLTLVPNTKGVLTK